MRLENTALEKRKQCRLLGIGNRKVSLVDKKDVLVMVRRSRKLRNIKGGIRVEKSVKEKKGGTESSEAGLYKWCRKRTEVEREVKDERDEENKKVKPKQAKNKAE